MSFRWQFGCGCNLETPESCYPQLLWRSIKLSDLFLKLADSKFSRTGLLIVRLDGPPAISGYGTISIDEIKLNGQKSSTIDYQYLSGILDYKGRPDLEAEDLVAEVSLRPMTIQHYYQQENGQVAQKIESFSFEDFNDGSQSAKSTSSLVETFYIQNQKIFYGTGYSLFYVRSTLAELWGVNCAVMAVKCCATPATEPRTTPIYSYANRKRVITGYELTRPLTLVADIRTGRIEWERDLDLTFKPSATSANIRYVKTYINDYGDEVFGRNESFDSGDFAKMIERGDQESYFAYYRTYYFGVSNTGTNSDFEFDENDSCVASFKSTEESRAQTGFVTLASQVGSGRGSNRVVTEKYQSRFAVPRVIDSNYDALHFQKYYDVNFIVDYWGYSFARKSSNGYYTNDWTTGYRTFGDRTQWAMGAFANDPNRDSNPFKRGTTADLRQKLTAPSDFFTYNNVCCRLSCDWILYRLYGIFTLGQKYVYGSGADLSEILSQWSQDKSQVFGFLALQSPVVLGKESVRLNWKRIASFAPEGRNIYDEEGNYVSRERDLPDSFEEDPYSSGAQMTERFTISGNNSLTVSPSWGLSNWFETGESVGKSFIAEPFRNFYGGFPSSRRELFVKQDFFKSQMGSPKWYVDDDSEWIVSVGCSGEWDSEQVDEVYADIEKNIEPFFEYQTRKYKRKIQCWTDNLFCVDIKQQFFDENGVRVNLVESNPDQR